MQEEQNADAQLRALVQAATEADKVTPALMRELESLRGHLSQIPDSRSLIRELGTVRGWGGYCKELLKELRDVQPPPLRVVPPDEAGAHSVGRTAARGLPEGWQDPVGYFCGESGIWFEREGKEGPEEIRIAPKPVWISQRWSDVDSGDHLVEVRWPGASEVVKRSLVLTAKDLPVLADKGAPVSSVNARGVVAWLHAAEEANEEIIPVSSSISRLGWCKGGEGRALQGPEGPHLLRAEDGHKQTVRALKPRGLWCDWLEAAKVIHKHPIPALLLAASVGSVLLEPCGASPFVVDLHGHSSRGKTTALRWAASAWADPTDAGAYLLPWSATQAAIEGRAGFLRNLPLCLDDTKKVPVKDREKLANLVYLWGGGQGKPRATPGGVLAVATWSSILLSTGEAPLTRLAGEHVGLRLRVLPISGQPLPDGDEAVSVIENLEAWAHLGPRVEAWALERWGSLRSEWASQKEKVAEKLAGGPSGSRLAGYVASIRMGVKALEDLGIELPAKEIGRLLLASARTALASADTASEAWEKIGAWLVTQQDRVSDKAREIEDRGEVKTVIVSDEKAPMGGWLGRVTGQDELAIAPPALEAELKRLGYDPDEIYPAWANSRRLLRKEDRYTTVVRWMGKSARLVVLSGLEGWIPKEAASGA